MHPSQVLADDAKGEELRAREDGDHRGQERKAGDAATLDEEADEHVKQGDGAHQREEEADQAGQPQRPGAETGEHVERDEPLFSEPSRHREITALGSRTVKEHDGRGSRQAGWKRGRKATALP